MLLSKAIYYIIRQDRLKVGKYMLVENIDKLLNEKDRITKEITDILNGSSVDTIIEKSVHFYSNTKLRRENFNILANHSLGELPLLREYIQEYLATFIFNSYEIIPLYSFRNKYCIAILIQIGRNKVVIPYETKEKFVEELFTRNLYHLVAHAIPFSQLPVMCKNELSLYLSDIGNEHNTEMKCKSVSFVKSMVRGEQDKYEVKLTVVEDNPTEYGISKLCVLRGVNKETDSRQLDKQENSINLFIEDKLTQEQEKIEITKEFIYPLFSHLNEFTLKETSTDRNSICCILTYSPTISLSLECMYINEKTFFVTWNIIYTGIVPNKTMYQGKSHIVYDSDNVRNNKLIQEINYVSKILYSNQI